jgi:hypothetical protein
MLVFKSKARGSFEHDEKTLLPSPAFEDETLSPDDVAFVEYSELYGRHTRTLRKLDLHLLPVSSSRTVLSQLTDERNELGHKGPLYRYETRSLNVRSTSSSPSSTDVPVFFLFMYSTAQPARHGVDNRYPAPVGCLCATQTSFRSSLASRGDEIAFRVCPPPGRAFD